MRRRRGWLLVIMATLLLSGCSALVKLDQPQTIPESRVTLEPGHTVGQTFVARHGGLSAVEVYLSSAPGSQGALVLHLRESPLSTVDIVTATSAVSADAQEGFYRFSFPPILHSHTRYWYMVLRYEGSGRVEVGTGEAGSYLDGALYYDHQSQESQTAFRLCYDPLGIVADLLLMAAGWLGYGVAALAVLFLGGYWIVRRWARRRGADFTSVLILSTTSALAAWMVFLVWASVFRIRLGPISVRLVAGAAVLAGLVCFVRDRAQWQRREYWLGDSPLATIALWVILLFSAALRLFAGRGLVMLPGSDAYHHTLIVQLFAEQGGIPRSYEPYAPLISFSYHFGFHSIVALFRWLFGTDLLLTTKTLALVMNGAVAATAGLLSEHLAGNRRAGVIAAAFVGLIMVSPFCLLRWSRFTQAAGLLFLAPALLMLLCKGERVDRVVSSLLVAATVFSHSRVAFFWGLFVLVAGVAGILQHRWDEVKGWLVMGALSTVLTAPWLLRIAWLQSDPYGLRVTYPVLAGYNDIERLEMPVLSFVTNWPVLIVSTTLVGAALVGEKGKKSGTVLALVIWCLALVGGALLSSLAGFSFWDLKTALLSLAVPVAVLAGLGGELLWDAFRRRKWSVAQGGLIAAATAGAVVAAGAFPGLVYAAPRDLQPGDLMAMKWIESNVPEDALFLVDAIPLDWSPGWIVGYGAGYWIPLLAHRATVVPPMLYSLEWADPILRGRLQPLQRIMMGQEETASSIGEVLDDQGVTHVFATASSGLLVPDVLSKDEHLQVIYHQDRVWVFAVKGSNGNLSPAEGVK